MRAAISRASPAAFEVYRDSYLSLRLPTPYSLQKQSKDRLQEMTIFVEAEKSGVIVGTIACSVVNPKKATFANGDILPAAQGSGIATGLLKHAKRTSAKAAAPDQSRYNRAAQAAIRFYERSGFFYVGEGPGLFGMPLYEYVKTI